MTNQDIALKIKNARPRTMTQDEACEALGISRATLSSYENGKTELTVQMLAKMCKVYGVEPSSLF